MKRTTKKRAKGYDEKTSRALAGAECLDKYGEQECVRAAKLHREIIGR